MCYINVLMQAWYTNISIVLSCVELSLFRRLVASWTSLRHLHLSSVSFSSFWNNILVHFSMLSIHRILGLLFFHVIHPSHKDAISLAFLLLEHCPAWSLSPDNLLLFSSHNHKHYTYPKKCLQFHICTMSCRPTYKLALGSHGNSVNFSYSRQIRSGGRSFAVLSSHRQCGQCIYYIG